MQRLLCNLAAVAVIGLISLSGSMAMAHGGGGGHSGGHSAGRSSSHASHNHSSQSHSRNTSKSKGQNKSVSKKNDRKPLRHPPRHRRPRYHMHYPAGFWFDGDIDDGDAVEGGLDVEFTSIRQIDAGDPAKNLAPAYRVWFHNNSTVDIDQPFDVAILASADEQLAKDLPYASVRVDGLAADETSSVDIRLPIEAMSMGGDDGKAAYTFLHTIIDSQKELVETNKANNLSVYDRKDIPALEE